MENEHRPSDSPYVERVYRSDGVSATGRMHSVASTHWELAVWTHRGSTHVAVRGPETRPSTVPVLPEISPFGILFAHGAAMPHLPISSLVDSAIRSPHVTSRAFVLRGQEWELPTYDNAEDFVDHLVRAGVLERDPLVTDVVADDDVPGLTARTVQRRVVAATGLTRGAIRQIQRARHAAMLLAEDIAPREVVQQLGYYDQPHLARSLARFIGRTATELRRPDLDDPLSLLYKTGR